MSWLFSRALVAEYLVGNCLGGVPSAQSSTTPMPQAFLSPDKMTDYSRLSRFGMTFEPLTEALGGAVLTWFLAGSPARTSAPPGRETGLPESGADSGWKWRESSVKYDPASASWKTRQCSLLGGLETFSETWPRWGTMRNGECWERPMWVRRTEGSGSGYWPTVTVCGNYNRKGASANSGDGLATAVKMWPTPTKSYGGGGPGCSGRAGGLNLRTAVTFPTPLARDWKNGSPAQRDKPRSENLNDRVSTEQCGQLNPMWVEWLMGWPLGWTDCKPLETDRCHNAPLRRSAGF